MTIREVSEKYGISQDTLRYYERIGMIPEVTRTSSGIRNYQPEDLGWVELAICMRGAGLPIEALIEYVKLCQKGDATIPARLQLLQEQKVHLEEQKQQLEAAYPYARHQVPPWHILILRMHIRTDNLTVLQMHQVPGITQELHLLLLSVLLPDDRFY